MTARGLVELASAIRRGGEPDSFDFSYPGSPVDTVARHPYDDGVVLGGIGVLRRLPGDVDAVVSLCRVADDDLPVGIPHVEVRLIDRVDADQNPHLDFVLLEAVRAVEELRREGRTVLVHCVGAYSRTPAVAVLYGARLRGVSVDQALADVGTVLPGAHPNGAFRAALRRLHATPTASERMFRWRGVLDANRLPRREVAVGHRFADAAKAGDWPAVFAMLDDSTTPVDMNWWRPGGTAWSTALHQAAWHDASTEVVTGLVDRGAVRSLRDAKGRTPYDVSVERHGRGKNCLRPPLSPLSRSAIAVLDEHLAEVIDDRLRRMYSDPQSVLRYPSVGILHELPRRALWFSVPDICGGFHISLQDDVVHVGSWSRMGYASQWHRIALSGAVVVNWGASPLSEHGSRADDCSGTWPVVPATARPPHGAPGEERARNSCKWWTSEGGVAGDGEQ